MDCQAAFEEHVRAKLEASFGKAVAMLIVASASNATNTNTMRLDAANYEKLCCAIVADQRVRDMWGALAADEALEQWKAEVS